MADPRFFQNAGPFELGELARRVGAELSDPLQGSVTITDVAPLDQAGQGQLTFLDNPKYASLLRETKAGACILAPRHAGQAPAGVALLISPRPYLAYARAAQAFYPVQKAAAGRHHSAVIDPSAMIGAGVAVGPLAVIGPGAEIGAGCEIGPGASIGRNVVLGDDCRVGPQVSLSHCVVGARVVFHPGARIGQDGFGFAPDAAGHVKVPQLGRVLIGDDCDIGANSCIDRGSGPDTVIGPGCWIDNLVQIGHNVTLGRGCILVSQSGIAGSTRLEDFVVVAAQSGVAGHLNIGAGAQIGAKSGVMNDIPAGEKHFGIPSTRIKDYFRQIATLRRLARARGNDNE